MRPRKPQKADHDDLFKARLDQILNMKHELVLLADKIDWDWLDAELAPYFSGHGRPAESVRFMIGMLLQKHTYTLSDEQVWDRWVENPYFQYFTGEEFFQHELVHERSGLSQMAFGPLRAGASGSATNWTFSWPRACASPMTPAP